MIIYQYRDCSQWMARDLKEHNWKINDRKTWERCIWIDLLEWAKKKKNVNIFVSHVNVQQSVTLARKILIVTWTGYPVLWIPVSLFPQQSLSLPSGFMKEVVMVSGREVMHGLYNMDFHSSKPFWLWVLLSAKLANNRDGTRASAMAPFLGVISQLSDGRLIMLECFCHGRGSIWFSLK